MEQRVKELEKEVATLKQNMEGVTKQLRGVQKSLGAAGGKVDPEISDFMKFAKEKLKYKTPGELAAEKKAAKNNEKGDS